MAQSISTMRHVVPRIASTLVGIFLTLAHASAVDVVITQASMNGALNTLRSTGALNFHASNLSGIETLSVHVQACGIELRPGNDVRLTLDLAAFVRKQWGIAWAMSANFTVSAKARLEAGPVDRSDLAKGYQVTVSVQSLDISNWKTNKSTLGQTIPDYIFSASKDSLVSWLTSAIPKYSVTAGVGVMKNLDNRYIEITPVLGTESGQLRLSFNTIASQVPIVGHPAPAAMQAVLALIEPLKADANDDGAVDKTDVEMIMAETNKPVSASSCGERCDPDQDGFITVLDARLAARLCTLPLCAR